MRWPSLTPGGMRALTCRARAARLATAARAAPEQVAEEITEVTEVVGGEGEVATAARTAEPAGHRPEAARFVVLLALRLVADHVVGRGDLLELVFRRLVT